MIETTTHCDWCENPLGIKCDQTADSAVRAKLHGVFVFCEFIKSSLSYRFFCSLKCMEKRMIVEGKYYESKKTLHKTKDEKKERGG